MRMGNPSKLLDWRADGIAVVIASGPSLTQADADAVRAAGARTIAVNRAFELAPWADVFYMGDRRALDVYHKQIPPGRLWSNDAMSEQMFGAKWARYAYEPGINPTRISGNGNSGMQAINLAVLFGARHILLLGFDMKVGPQGEKHFHPDHPAPLTQAQPFSDWIFKGVKVAEDLRKLGVFCLDCTPGGALYGFEKATLQEGIERCRALASW
jgi:hypothetical protein